MIEQKQMKNVVEENFERYAGNVILDRAICDVRDMLKPSARMLLYSQMSISKNTHKKPFIKSARVVGDCLGHLYEHGDSSCYGSYMRMGRPSAMRVRLEEVQGNCGTMIKSGDEAAMRYTELRLSEIASYLYDGLEKNAIGNQWKKNFDETETYPGVMPSIGYFNICNGTQGLGIAISSSIPQFNLREVNDAIIALIKNPAAPNNEIIIMPDFATGATLMNASEVYESLINGQGKSCRLRAKMEYNPDKNYIHVTEIPYGVYTETIVNELRAQLNENENYGVKSIDDNTGETADIIISLEKGVNPKKMMEKLYKDTSLESFFTINMWVLKDGRYPQVMGLREIFQNYIDHIRVCEHNIKQFELDKALARKNIVDGLIKAYSIIDEVVALIRASNTPAEASKKLIETYQFNEEQAKAILAMKLSSLTKLDIVKLEDEREELIEVIDKLRYILNTPTALDDELVKILREVADKFGDARRTKILNLVEADTEATEPIQEEEVGIMLFSNNMLRVVKKDDLQGAKRGRKGVNIKAPKNSNLINTLYTVNTGMVAGFTSLGRMYSFSLAELDFNTDYSVYELMHLQDNEKVILLIDTTSFSAYHNLITLSKHGYIKKSAITEYNSRAKKGVVAVKLEDGDSLVGVYLSMSDEDKMFVASSSGNYNFYEVGEISATGRATKGVKAIKLEKDEYVQSATIVKKEIGYKGILTITSGGRGKITPISDFATTSRAIKGSRVMDTNTEALAVTYAIPETQEKVFVSANNKAVIIDVAALPVQNRVTAGVRIIDARDSQTTIEIM